MKFLKKKIGSAKSRVKKTAKLDVLEDIPSEDTPFSDELMKIEGHDSSMSDSEVVRRKAEFLELLAKEERAHRVKLAKLRNEPIPDRRSTDNDIDSETKTTEIEASTTVYETNNTVVEASTADIEAKTTDIVSETKKRTPLPAVSPSFDSKDEPATAKTLDEDPSFTTRIAPPLEAQTRADIAKQIGGSDFLKGSSASFAAPEFTAKITDDAPRVDVTPRTNVDVTPRAKKDPYDDMDFSRPANGSRASVNELRLDVSRIYSDIENGDALYRRAQQRVQSLMHFVDKAEVDFSLLERIEPENRRLKARNAVISKELENNVRKTSVLEAEFDEHRRRLSEVNVQYDTINGNLAKAMKALSERDREIRQLTNDISAITLKLDREKTTTEVEIRENKVLRERVVNLTNDLEDAKASRADTTKMAESLKVDLEDHRSSRDRLETEAYDLRHALDEAQKQNNQMKGEMVSLHQDISTFKTQYEFNIISRDDRIALLETQIEDLARQLQVKEDILSSAARDVTELRKGRTGGELERERLEKIIDTQTRQLETAQLQITESQSVMEEMDTRYRDVAAALSITQNRRAQQAPAREPDIHPHMNSAERSAAPRAQITDDYGTQEHNAIDDHIMEYKLGLRNSLIPDELKNKLDKVTVAEADRAPSTAPSPRRDDNFEALDQDSIQDRIMDYKLGLRKNIF